MKVKNMKKNGSLFAYFNVKNYNIFLRKQKIINVQWTKNWNFLPLKALLGKFEKNTFEFSI